MSKLSIGLVILYTLLLSACNAVANNPVAFEHSFPGESLSDQEKSQRYQQALSAIRRVSHVQGPLLADSRLFQLAIDGPGFFVLYDEATQEVFYTRQGRFHINAFGQISNNQGLILQPEIKVREDLDSIYISEDGGLWSEHLITKETKLLGHIKLAYFSASEKLVLQDKNTAGLYKESSESGPAGLGHAGHNGFGLVIAQAKEAFALLPQHTSSLECQNTSLKKTDRALDWGIDGPGFFVLFHPLTGEYLFSRHGHFSVVNQNSRALLSPEGEIVNEYGYRLFEAEQFLQTEETRAYGVGGLILSPKQNFHTISPLGVVRVTEGSEPQIRDFGQIKLAFFDDLSILEPMGFSRSTIYRVKPEIVQKSTLQEELFHLANPGTDSMGTIQSGYQADCSGAL